MDFFIHRIKLKEFSKQIQILNEGMPKGKQRSSDLQTR